MYFIMIINLMFMLIMIMLGVSFFTLSERKILGYIQNRKGPNKVGFKGLFQSFSDAIKLMMKEWFFFQYSSLFYISPMMMLFMSMILWIMYPWLYTMYDLSYSLIVFVMLLGVSVFPLLMIGWMSSCNYSMLGVMRLISQTISFEIGLFLLIFNMMLMIEDYSFLDFYYFQIKIKFIILLFPLYLVFFMSMLIELNRTPFDLIEGESELVSGFNTEHYGVTFMMIFLSEYMNIMFMSVIIVIVFFGFAYWSLSFILFYILHMFLIIMIRGVLPRVRYDSLMYMCWTDLLIVVLIYLLNIYLLKELNLLI